MADPLKNLLNAGNAALSTGVKNFFGTGSAATAGVSIPGNGDSNTSPTAPAASLGIPYAMDLVPFNFKHKFLYVVNFVFETGFQPSSSDGNYNFALFTRSATRPSPKFETDEINMYGFREPVVKRTKFDPISFEFLDDNSNRMMEFFTTCSRWMSPITNFTPEESANVYESQYAFYLNSATHNDGIYKGKPNVGFHKYAVSANPERFLKQIDIIHVYEYGALVNKFHLYNPVVTELSLDGLDMSSSEPNMLKVNVDYTHFSVDIGQEMTKEIAELASSATHIMRPDLR